MNSDLLECKVKAKEIVPSQNSPRHENGRKKGYMAIMRELWSERGYSDLGLSCQNRRDQAARLEETFGNVQGTILKNTGGEKRQFVEQGEGENLLFEDQDSNIEAEQSTAESPVLTPMDLNPCAHEILDGATSILASISPIIGEFGRRTIDTRIKQRPTRMDVKNINAAIDVLMRREVEHSIDPTTNPFGYLWMANCILYSVVAAFLINKRWKKESGIKVQKKRKTIGQTMKEAFLTQATELRKRISIATAELDRIKKNKKITKRGKRNRRAMLERECGKVSAASLVAYIERKKSDLRKAKGGFIRKQKQEEIRSLNSKFYVDPGSVYDRFNEIIKSDPENNKPRYMKSTGERSEEQQGIFENITEAGSYWKDLWEQPCIATNSDATWLEDVRCAFTELVPVPPQEDFELDTVKCAYVIKRKRNWSAPGPDRIVNFCWKKAESLHKGIAASFQAAVVGDEEYPEWFKGGKTSLLPRPSKTKTKGLLHALTTSTSGSPRVYSLHWISTLRSTIC